MSSPGRCKHSPSAIGTICKCGSSNARSRGRIAARTNLGPLRLVSRTVPTVFTGVSDPVGAGFGESLARPGGNATGFISFEWTLSGKWLELLKEIAPGVTRAVVLRDTEVGPGASQFAVIQALAPSLRVEVNPVNVGGAAEIERAVA